MGVSVVAIRPKVTVDIDAEFFFLGEFCPEEDPGAMSRTLDFGDKPKHNEFSGWKPVNPVDGDDYPIEYVAQDYWRHIALCNEDWCYLFVGLEAELMVETVTGIIFTQKIFSPGCGGVESDSSADYIKLVLEEEYEALNEILRELGIPKANVELAPRLGSKESGFIGGNINNTWKGMKGNVD